MNIQNEGGYSYETACGKKGIESWTKSHVLSMILEAVCTTADFVQSINESGFEEEMKLVL